jgi:hypothetical protein
MIIGNGVLSAAVLAFVPIFAAADARADSNPWSVETIADALQAAPPAVTDNATILGWTSDGELAVARHGAGPYTCIARLLLGTARKAGAALS